MIRYVHVDLSCKVSLRRTFDCSLYTVLMNSLARLSAFLSNKNVERSKVQTTILLAAAPRSILDSVFTVARKAARESLAGLQRVMRHKNCVYFNAFSEYEKSGTERLCRLMPRVFFSSCQVSKLSAQ